MNSITGQILATIGIGVVNLLVTVIAILSVDKVGRRNLLLYGFSGMLFSLLALCVFSLYQVVWLPFLSVACLILYIFLFVSECRTNTAYCNGRNISSACAWRRNGVLCNE